MAKTINKRTQVFLVIGITCIALLLAYLHFYGGSSGPVTVEKVGSSTIFSENDIQAAMDVVQESFLENFPDCTLTELWYDEELSNQEVDDWKEQYQADEVIVLMSNFDVGPSGGDGSLEPNTTYKDWKWVLARTPESGTWMFKTWGYA